MTRRILVLGIVWFCVGCAVPPSSRSPGVDPEPVGPLALPEAARSPIAPERVLLISISGLRAEHYRSQRGRRPLMPAAGQLARASVSADAVRPVTPGSIYPAHATLVTGHRPDRHGVVGDRLLGERGIRPARYLHASRLQQIPLWVLAEESGFAVAALGWPSTLEAPVDLLLPRLAQVSGGEGWLGMLRDTTTPWLFERLSQLEPASRWIAGWPTPRERDAALIDLSCAIAGTGRPPRLWLLHLGQTAEALVRFGPGSDQADEAFRAVDGELVRLFACLRDSALLESSAILIVGDHAVLPVHTRVNPNVALLAANLMAGDPRSETGVGAWLAIVQSNGGSAFVYARSESDAVEARRVLSDEARRTEAFRVVSASELQALRADPQAWFGLEAEPGFIFGDDAVAPSLEPAVARGIGGQLSSHRGSDVGFIAWGRGVRHGVRVPRMRQIDVAPTVATLLGLGLDDAEGRPVIGALHPGLGDGRATSPPASGPGSPR